MIGRVFVRSQVEFQNRITAKWLQQSLNRTKAVLNGQNGPSGSNQVREIPWSNRSERRNEAKKRQAKTGRGIAAGESMLLGCEGYPPCP
jgi:hypothetical protein